MLHCPLQEERQWPPSYLSRQIPALWQATSLPDFGGCSFSRPRWTSHKACSMHGDTDIHGLTPRFEWQKIHVAVPEAPIWCFSLTASMEPRCHTRAVSWEVQACEVDMRPRYVSMLEL